MQEDSVLTSETAFQRYSLKDLLDDPGISLETSSAIIISAPYLQDLPPEKIPEINKRIQETNKRLPEIEKIVLEVLEIISSQSTDESTDSLNSGVSQRETGIETFSVIECLMEQKYIQEKLNIDDKDIYQIALTQIGLGLAIRLYRSAEEPEKSSWLAYAFHYAALQSLATGIKTGGTAFIINADDKSFVVPTDEVLTIGIVASKKQLERSHIRLVYEGVPLTPIMESGKNNPYFIAHTNPEE